MAKKHLSNAPHHVSEDVWWYEETNGIDLHINHTKNGHESHLIPWPDVRKALKRKDKKA